MEAPLEFKMPMHAIDVELAMEDRFCVEDVWDVSEESAASLSSALEEIGDALLQDGDSWSSIATNYVFDKLYSVTKFWTEINAATQTQLVRTLSDGLASVLAAVRKAGDDKDGMAARRNAFKMFVFLLTEAAARTVAAASTAARPSKDAKTVPALTGALTAAVHTLTQAADSPLGRMWSLGVPEEEFVATFSKTALKIMDSAPLMKSRALKKECIELAALCLTKFSTSTASCLLTIMHMLASSEHAVPIIAEMVKVAVMDHNNERLLADTLREIGNTDAAASKDSAGVRNLSSFLMEVATRVPTSFLRHLEAVLPHLEGESYALRSAVVACLGSMVAARDEHADEATESQIASTREVLLDVMQERVYDVHAFTRAAVLRAWTKLVLDGGVPLERYHTIAELAVDRLCDKAAVVRKASVQLLRELLLHNPFAPTLNLDLFRAQIAKEDAWLAANVPAELAPASATAAPAMETIGEEGEEEEEEGGGDAQGGARGVLETKSDDGEEPVGGDAVEKPAAEADGPELTADHRRHLSLRALCLAAVEFTTHMGAAVPTLCQLMGSKTASDAIAAVKFLTHAKSFGLPGIADGLQKMLTLVWSNEQTVREEVLAAFTALYVTKPMPGGRTAPQAPADVARTLVALVAGSTLAVTTSLERILAVLCDNGTIDPAMVKTLWGMVEVDASSDDAARAASRSAMGLVTMMAKARSSVVDCPQGLTRIGQVLESSLDYRLARHACAALRVLPRTGDDSMTRHASIDSLITNICAMIRGDWNEELAAPETNFYFAAAEEGIAAVFHLSARPEYECEQVVKYMTRRTLLDEDVDMAHVPRAQLAQLFFVAGHVAFKMLMHAEALTSRVKKLRAKTVEAKTTAATASGTEDSKSAIEQELGLAAAAEEADNEMMREIADKHIVGRNLLGVFGPLIVRVVANEGAHFSDTEGEDMLLQSAVLALCKFMTISSEFCAKNLQVLFTVLQNARQASLRATISIALGDLASRFPNLIEPWTPHLYARLRDPELRVRKNTLMVLTHLILNDMVKVKGQIAEIAVCLEDEEPRMRDLTRLFFHELSKRGNNPVYNLLPDTLGCLSTHESLTKSSFRSIMKYLLGFIRRDKQSENLLEKLSYRFQTTDDLVQWRELAFCMAQLQVSEKGVRKLAEGFRLYKHTLTDVDVLDAIRGIAIKAKKNAKGEFKDFVMEWEKKLVDAHGRGDELDDSTTAEEDSKAEDGKEAEDGSVEAAAA